MSRWELRSVAIDLLARRCFAKSGCLTHSLDDVAPQKLLPRNKLRPKRLSNMLSELQNSHSFDQVLSGDFYTTEDVFISFPTCRCRRCFSTSTIPATLAWGVSAWFGLIRHQPYDPLISPFGPRTSMQRRILGKVGAASRRWSSNVLKRWQPKGWHNILHWSHMMTTGRNVTRWPIRSKCVRHARHFRGLICFLSFHNQTSWESFQIHSTGQELVFRSHHVAGRLEPYPCGIWMPRCSSVRHPGILFCRSMPWLEGVSTFQYVSRSFFRWKLPCPRSWFLP